jgi:hypothetical protein
VAMGWIPTLKCVVRRTWEPVSCLALNDHAIRGHRLSGHLPGIRDSWVRLPGSRVRAEPGQNDESNRVNRW